MKDPRRIEAGKKRWKGLSAEERTARNRNAWETRRSKGWVSPLKRYGSRQERRLMQLGLSREEALQQLEKTKCDCCGRDFGATTPHIDHDHQTGKFRGMIHLQCNVAIGMFKDDPGAVALAARYVDPFYRSSLNQDSGSGYMDQLERLSEEDVAGLLKAAESYGSSWKQGGGQNAFAMLKRKWDRILLQVSKPRIGLDIFKAIATDTRAEGIIDDIRDLRRYLMLVEAEMRSRGAESAVTTHRDNQQ